MAAGDAFSRVVAALGDRIKTRQDGKVTAACPGAAHQHGDRHASLSVGTGHDGAVLKCFAGCTTADILAPIGLSLSDLFDTPRKSRQGGRGRSTPPRNTATLQHGCTLAAYADAKRLPVEKLKTFGLSDITYDSAPAVRIPYRDVNGQEQAVRIRRALLKGPDGDERFTWRKGTKVSLYGLDRLAEARQTKHIALVEGESDCHTLWCHGIPAIGLPGASSYKEEWASHFDGLETIDVVIEPDTGGANILKWLPTASIRDRVRLVRLDGHKDPSALHVANSEAFEAAWQAALAAAEPWPQYAERQQQETATAAWAQCSTLAQRPDILAELDLSLVRHGVVGERQATRLVYLAATSRLQPRPVSIAVKGPSSSGKSYVVEQVLKHFPPAAYHSLSAMSERALAYSEEPLKHRMLVLYEAAGLSSDFASYLVRSLLSEGCVKYETVEKTKDGLRPRLIVREGPTGLITTTTAVHLHPENETRLLSINVTDSPDQTRRVLRALSEDRGDQVDEGLAVWRALQVWLATAEQRVVVPFALPLAEQIPPVAIRLRRDFTTLLSLIRAHAVLHQATRDRDAGGRIIATVHDYAVIRGLVLDLFDQALQATVSETVRQTVEAVAALNGVAKQPASLGKVASRLHLDTSTVSRRVKVALAAGYLENLETRRGQAMKLVTGDPLPEALPLLPEPASLEACCSVAVLPEGIKHPLPPLVHETDARERVRL